MDENLHGVLGRVATRPSVGDWIYCQGKKRWQITRIEGNYFVVDDIWALIKRHFR